MSTKMLNIINFNKKNKIQGFFIRVVSFIIINKRIYRYQKCYQFFFFENKFYRHFESREKDRYFLKFSCLSYFLKKCLIFFFIKSRFNKETSFFLNKKRGFDKRNKKIIKLLIDFVFEVDVEKTF